jgi:hypothetical protein
MAAMAFVKLVTGNECKRSIANYKSSDIYDLSNKPIKQT